MELILWSVFLCLSLILVALGLFKSEHTELSLVGFLFLFLLALVLINNELTIKIGENNLKTYIYGDNYTDEHWSHDTDRPTCNPSNPLECVALFHINETTTYIYESAELGAGISRLVGYWLAVISLVGFVGVILSLRRIY